MEAIPVAVRRRIIKLYDEGHSTWHIAQALGYCQAAVRRVRQHFKERGTLEPWTHRCGRTGFFTAERQTRLKQLVADKPDATLAELCHKMDRPVAVSTMDVWVRKLGLSFKKSPCMPPSNCGRTSPKSARGGMPTSRRPR